MIGTRSYGKFSQVKIINFISRTIYPLTSFVVKQLFLVVFLKQRGTPILLPGSLRVHQILLKHSRNLPKPDSLPIQIRVRMPSNMLLLLHEEKDWHTATTSILTVSFSLAFTSSTTQSISLRSISKNCGNVLILSMTKRDASRSARAIRIQPMATDLVPSSPILSSFRKRSFRIN